MQREREGTRCSVHVGQVGRSNSCSSLFSRTPQSIAEAEKRKATHNLHPLVQRHVEDTHDIFQPLVVEDDPDGVCLSRSVRHHRFHQDGVPHTSSCKHSRFVNSVGLVGMSNDVEQSTNECSIIFNVTSKRACQELDEGLDEGGRGRV